MPSVKKAANVASWTFLSNHAHVLLCIARDAEVRMRDLAAMVGITERAVQRIIDDLAQAGYIDIERDGRRNRYRINGKLKLRHPVEEHCEVAELIVLVNGRQSSHSKN
ncbi:MAG: winged helix-turn-helix transcriptional regulator [Acidobacteriota bacterium]|nr:winged helix-turn-helix transcriptional regulator [Acidobacteriota bacterium]